jgi:hypothetical protein
MLDFEVQRCTRRCAATDRNLEPGETFYSVLTVQGAEVVRRDYSEAAWDEPPHGALGWWKSQMPSGEGKRPRLAPNEILLELFLRWQQDPGRADILYVLTLLMIRRRVVRLEATRTDECGQELVVYCARNGETFHVRLVQPTDERVSEIQAELGELLFARVG